MNFLKQVINVLSKYELNIDLFDEKVLENTALFRLYEGVRTGVFSSDEEAAFDIYRSKSLDARYRNLKSRLKRKLSNNLFFLRIDQPDHSEYLVAVHEIFQQVFVFRTLSSLGAETAAYQVAEQTLAKAQKFHLTNAIIDCLITLRNLAAYQGDSAQYKVYADQLHFYLEVQSCEVTAADHSHNVTMNFIHSRSTTTDAIKEIEKATKIINKLWNKYQTYSLFLLNFRLSLILTQANGDYQLALYVCDDAENFLSINQHFATSTRLAEIALYRTASYFYLRKYKEGLHQAQQTVHLLREGGSSWFSFLEHYFLLSFHDIDYQQAKKLYQQVTTHINFDTGITRRKETWEIFGLYLSFVEGSDTPDMERFMKDMEVYKHDKSGVYVAVLALSILVLLRKGERNSIINRDEYLKKYLTRYLRGDDHVRSAAFFKLLRMLIRYDFDINKVRQQGEQHLAVLHDRSLRLDDYEVMPYERMWHYVEATLDPTAEPVPGAVDIPADSEATTAESADAVPPDTETTDNTADDTTDNTAASAEPEQHPEESDDTPASPSA